MKSVYSPASRASCVMTIGNPITVTLSPMHYAMRTISGKPKRGRVKRSKARNLLERLINYEDDVLRFMENPLVPFTNNLGENDIRMTKVQQKISGCFRSAEGAKIFCRVRGYLSTCRKQGITASHALKLVFEGKLPDFVA